MTEIVFIAEETPEGGFTARALEHSIITETDTMNLLKEMITDAVKCHFEKDKLPKMVRIHFVKDEVFSLVA